MLRILTLVFATAAIGLLLHAAVPRYDWREVDNPAVLLRIDRWTGATELGTVRSDWGRWASLREQRRHP